MDDNGFPPFLELKGPNPVEFVIEGWSSGPDRFNPGAEIPIAQAKTADGKLWSCWLSPSVIRSRFAALKPKVGERVRISYLGQRQGANAEYSHFLVECPDRPPYEPDWDSIGASADESWG